ncbi:hypothetical protein GG851_05380 [Bordetella petrii]|nr:hypothetical protein [Bordetella petrii]
MNEDDRVDTLRMIGEAAEAYARPDAQRTRRSRDRHEGLDPQVWSELARQGWLSAMPAQGQGGLGLGLAAAAAIAERLGYGCYLEPYVETAVLAAHCLSRCTSPRAASLLEALMAGRQLVAVAWQADDAGQGTRPPRLGIEPVPSDGLTVSGHFRYILPAQAQWFILPIAVEDELRLIALARDTPGLDITIERGADGVPQARLALNAARIDPQADLQVGPSASQVLDDALCAATVACAAELLGAMHRALDMSLQYLETRQQFGKPIGAFQVLQHRAVDMWIQQQLAAAALRTALDSVDSETTDAQARQAAASSVKARASYAGQWIAEQAVQLHGAIGITDEYELGVYVNRILALAARFGNAALHRKRYGALCPVEER